MKRDAIHTHAAVREHAQQDSGSQVERATLGLRELLLRGAFRPGQRIAEIPLSKTLGVSRTPLRLAFERLEHEGLVRVLPNSGFAAREFSMADIWDALETRSILEGASARLAAERFNNPSALERLRKINRDMEEIPNLEMEGMIRYLDMNEVFHLAIMDFAKNQALRGALEQIYKVPFVSPGGRIILRHSLPAWTALRPIGEEHHRILVDAIEHREGARAESVAREHGRITRRHLEDALADKNFLVTMPGGPLIKFRKGDPA